MNVIVFDDLPAEYNKLILDSLSFNNYYIWNVVQFVVAFGSTNYTLFYPKYNILSIAEPVVYGYIVILTPICHITYISLIFICASLHVRIFEGITIYADYPFCYVNLYVKLHTDISNDPCPLNFYKYTAKLMP